LKVDGFINKTNTHKHQYVRPSIFRVKRLLAANQLLLLPECDAERLPVKQKPERGRLSREALVVIQSGVNRESRIKKYPHHTAQPLLVVDYDCFYSR